MVHGTWTCTSALNPGRVGYNTVSEDAKRGESARRERGEREGFRVVHFEVLVNTVLTSLKYSLCLFSTLAH